MGLRILNKQVVLKASDLAYFMQQLEGRLVNIRRLVALDIFLHGSRFILIEFGVGTPAIILVGLWLTLTGTSVILGIYFFLTGVNYLPLLIYAILIVKKHSAESEVKNGLAQNPHYVRKYSLQQLVIFIPLAIVAVALIQETQKSSKKQLSV